MLDLEEVYSCIQNLEYIKENLINTTPELYTEVKYITHSGFMLGAMYNPQDGRPQWTVFVQTEKYSPNSIEFLYAKSLGELITVFKAGKQIINENIGK